MWGMPELESLEDILCEYCGMLSDELDRSRDGLCTTGKRNRRVMALTDANVMLADIRHMLAKGGTYEIEVPTDD